VDEIVPGEKAEERWFPEYIVPVNGRDMKARVDLEAEECPVSFLLRNEWGGEIRNMVTEIGKAQRVHEGTGSWPGGADSAAWDARWFDAVEIAEIEKRRLDRAIDRVVEGIRMPQQQGVM
jgi:hypothetical protein